MYSPHLGAVEAPHGHHPGKGARAAGRAEPGGVRGGSADHVRVDSGVKARRGDFKFTEEEGCWLDLATVCRQAKGPWLLDFIKPSGGVCRYRRVVERHKFRSRRPSSRSCLSEIRDFDMEREIHTSLELAVEILVNGDARHSQSLHPRAVHSKEIHSQEWLPTL